MTIFLLRTLILGFSFTDRPNKETIVKSLMKNPQDAEIGYQVLQWLYSLDVKPTIPGIQNMARLLTAGNPKIKTVKMKDMVDETPFQRLEKSAFYRDVAAQAKK